jgi:DNA-binding transcriptional regulator YdaS (Cro superfamily)
MPLWAEMVLKVEAATGISRHELRPDIYPIEPPAAVEADPASRAEPVPDSDLRSSSGTGDPLGMVA